MSNTDSLQENEVYDCKHSSIKGPHGSGNYDYDHLKYLPQDHIEMPPLLSQW